MLVSFRYALPIKNKGGRQMATKKKGAKKKAAKKKGKKPAKKPTKRRQPSPTGTVGDPGHGG
jgi:hypothetical protein